MIQKSGIFLVKKEKGITSNDLVQIIKKKFKYKKVGHAGTLDPLATGLMIILVNQATKISNYILRDEKKYRVVIKMFLQTDSFDITGNTVETMEHKKISKNEIKDCVNFFNGYMYDQYPPIYSAVKVNGKKLYEYARKNQEVEIKPRTVTISSCELVNFDSKNNEITLDVLCSKGTYIRSFVNDFMKNMNIIGTVKELERLASGNFKVENALTVEELSNDNIISMYDALMENELPTILYHQEKDIQQGKPIQILGNNSHEIIFIVNYKQEVIALYKRAAQDLYICVRGLWEQDQSVQLTEAEKDGR